MRIRALASLTLAFLSACAGGADDAGVEASGTVEATQVDLAFQLPGRIAALVPREGDRVTTGQLIGHLDTLEIAARRAGARAQHDAARALLGELESGSRTEEIAQARLALTAADRRLEEQERETARTVRLAEGGAVSRERREQSETALLVARADRDRLAEQVALLQAGPRLERIAAQRAALAQAQSQVDQAEALLGQMVLSAPFDGVVTLRHREPGEVVGAGMPVITIINPAERWIRVYVPQDLVGRIRIGQEVTFLTDGFPERTFTGEVTSIATEAEFTPRNVQTREERVKLVHAVRVRVLADEALDVKPGLAADVRFEAPPA
jgi:HlyD family secretion protein